MTKQRSKRVRAGTAAPAGAAAVVVAAVVAAALLVAACGAVAPQNSATTAPASPFPAGSVAAASASPTPSAMPPLDRPTKKRPLRIYFGGDSLSGMPGMWLGILRKRDGLARVKADYVESSRLTWSEPVDWPARVKRQMGAGRWDVGVFMIGANDSGMPMIAGGKSVMYPKKAWLQEYERRARQIATIMLRAGVRHVYWVGMPIMPSSSESKKMRDLNEVFRDVAAGSPDVEYVDSYDLLSTKDGGIDASLRSGDGVHYTDEGARTVARAVWKAIRQGWAGD